jgi:peptidyl-prolyl cis-trans isomerase D
VVAPLNNPNDVGEQTGIKGGFAIPMLVEKKDPRTPDFEEVKTKVAGVVKQQRAQEQLEQKAKEIVAASNDVAGLKAAAEKAGFEVATEEAYKLGSQLGKAGTTPALDEAIYAMKTGEVTKSPLKVGDTFVVLGIADRKEADLAEFAKQRDQLTQTMLSARQNQIYEDYLGAVEQRMKRDGKIKVYQDVLAALEESEPEVAAPPQRQFPMPAR